MGWPVRFLVAWYLGIRMKMLNARERVLLIRSFILSRLRLLRRLEQLLWKRSKGEVTVWRGRFVGRCCVTVRGCVASEEIA